jgi:hypothetical protein
MNVPMKHVFRMSLAAGLFLLGSIQLHASIVCCPHGILGAPLFDFVHCGGNSCGSNVSLTPGVGVQVGSGIQGVTLTPTGIWGPGDGPMFNPSLPVDLGNGGEAHVGPVNFVYMNQPASLAGDLTFTFDGFTLSGLVVDLNANPANGGVTITALGAGGTAIEQAVNVLNPAGPGILLQEFVTISEASSVLTGFRISNGNAVVFEGGNFSGLAATAATAPESGSAVLIFAAMFLFALRTLAQRYCLCRDQRARDRLTSRV